MTDYSNVYFIGAGGIGMAALEFYCLARGKAVAGYDRTPSALTRHLERDGAVISFEDSVDAIPAAFRNPATTLVVYTPAVPADHPVMRYFAEGGFEVIKRAEFLGRVTRSARGICFAGTHGKTTTSSMAAHILNSGEDGCTAFLGGVLRNIDSNLMLSDRTDLVVIEADEYDRSFHRLRPYVAVITSTDPDHLDIYGTEEAYLESFAHFTELIRPDGALLVHSGLKLRPRPAQGVRVYTYGANDPQADFHAENIRRSPGRIVFDIATPTGRISDIDLGVPVEINIDNAVAAVGALWLADALDADTARAALGSYLGAERRFQFHRKDDMPGGHVVIDDYAHHPDELLASIRSVRQLYPGSHLTVAFQPHLYTRTRDFAPQFAAALSHADRVVMVPIYPAREEPIEGVDSQMVLDMVDCPDKLTVDKDRLPALLAERDFEVLVVAGAGDINLQIPAILDSIDNK